MLKLLLITAGRGNAHNAKSFVPCPKSAFRLCCGILDRSHIGRSLRLQTPFAAARSMQSLATTSNGWDALCAPFSSSKPRRIAEWSLVAYTRNALKKCSTPASHVPIDLGEGFLASLMLGHNFRTPGQRGKHGPLRVFEAWRNPVRTIQRPHPRPLP